MGGLLLARTLRDGAFISWDGDFQDIVGGVPLAMLGVLREGRTTAPGVPHWGTIGGKIKGIGDWGLGNLALRHPGMRKVIITSGAVSMIQRI